MDRKLIAGELLKVARDLVGADDISSIMKKNKSEFNNEYKNWNSREKDIKKLRRENNVNENKAIKDLEKKISELKREMQKTKTDFGKTGDSLYKDWLKGWKEYISFIKKSYESEARVVGRDNMKDEMLKDYRFKHLPPTGYDQLWKLINK